MTYDLLCLAFMGCANVGQLATVMQAVNTAYMDGTISGEQFTKLIGKITAHANSLANSL